MSETDYTEEVSTEETDPPPVNEIDTLPPDEEGAVPPKDLKTNVGGWDGTPPGMEQDDADSGA